MVTIEAVACDQRTAHLVLLAKSEYGTGKLLVVESAVIPITGHKGNGNRFPYPLITPVF
jgi:hypothetical protein